MIDTEEQLEPPWNYADKIPSDNRHVMIEDIFGVKIPCKFLSANLAEWEFEGFTVKADIVNRWCYLDGWETE